MKLRAPIAVCAVLAACAPAPHAELPVAAREPTAIAASCAEADVNLDLRAWPTSMPIDVAQESSYQASKFRDLAPKGASVRVYAKTSYGFVARFEAATERAAFAQCAAGVDAYLPGAPTRHPLDHSPVVVACHACGKDAPAGAAVQLRQDEALSDAGPRSLDGSR